MRKSSMPSYVIIHYDKMRGLPPVSIYMDNLTNRMATKMTEAAYERKYGKTMEQPE